MTNPTPHVVLIHGMGEHGEAEFKKTFTAPLDKASEHFSSIQKISKNTKLHFISYNEIFKKIRKNADKAAIDSMAAQFTGAPALITSLNNFNNSADSNSFFYTHIMDVLFYRSYFADAIQSSVGVQLLEAMKASGEAGEDLHIVCHSLGTAVMHDTLHKLYTNSLNDEKGEPLLCSGLNKIRSITMVANVCQLPITEANPYTSVVKPGPDGICDFFTTCRHKLDPIASFTKFDVSNHWPYVTGSEFSNIVISGVERANVHDLDHYLADPKVFLRIFTTLFQNSFYTTSSKIAAAEKAHATTTVQGKFDKLKETIEDSEISLYWDKDDQEFVFSADAKSLYKQLTSFYQHLKEMTGEIDNTTGDNSDD